MAGASGKKLDETYKLAWLRGLKTTYYLRTTSATYAEKSTVAPGALNACVDGRAAAWQCRRGASPTPSRPATSSSAPSTTPTAKPASEPFARTSIADSQPAHSPVQASTRDGAAASMRCCNNELRFMSTSAWCLHATLR
jgi:ribonucleotide reductase alpha subunit